MSDGGSNTGGTTGSTGTLAALLVTARATGDFAPLVAAVPYARFLGISIEKSAAGELQTRLTFAPHIVGNSLLPALHGGAIGSLLESTAIFGLLCQDLGAPPPDAEAIVVAMAPRTISITVEYLRSARTVDTLARAEITRQGRRVATVRALAWQDDPARPIAAANAHFLLG